MKKILNTDEEKNDFKKKSDLDQKSWQNWRNLFWRIFSFKMQPLYDILFYDTEFKYI